MSKRNYTKMDQLEGSILGMRAIGMTRQEIANALGLEKEQIKNWIGRHNRKERMLQKGVTPKGKGRPRKDGQLPPRDPQKELEQLRMENKLLRDFLSLTERM